MNEIAPSTPSGRSPRDETDDVEGDVPGFQASEANHASERKSPTCLVVEDDGTMRHLVTNYLEDHDIRAISASRRDEVAGLLARSQPDLVILDLGSARKMGLICCARSAHSPTFP